MSAKLSFVLVELIVYVQRILGGETLMGGKKSPFSLKWHLEQVSCVWLKSKKDKPEIDDHITNRLPISGVAQ